MAITETCASVVESLPVCNSTKIEKDSVDTCRDTAMALKLQATIAHTVISGTTKDVIIFDVNFT